MTETRALDYLLELEPEEFSLQSSKIYLTTLTYWLWKQPRSCCRWHSTSVSVTVTVL